RISASHIKRRDAFESDGPKHETTRRFGSRGLQIYDRSQIASFCAYAIMAASPPSRARYQRETRRNLPILNLGKPVHMPETGVQFDPSCALLPKFSTNVRTSQSK